MFVRMSQRVIACCLFAAFVLPAGLSLAAQPSYPETAEGLKKLTEDVIAAIKAGKPEAAAPLIKSMLLPEHENWFKKTFGEEQGKAFADDYAKAVKTFDEAMLKLLSEQIEKGRTNVSAYKLTGPDDKNATGLQQKAMEAMKQKTPLYGVRMIEPGKDAGFHLWSFVYVDGTFRLAGKMRMGPAK